MSLPPIVRSATLPLQVLISGRVEDSLTPGEVPRSSLTVRLLELDPLTSESEDYPLKVNVRPDGTFAVFGVPEIAFPGIDQKKYNLRLEASAPNYESATFDLKIGPIAGQPKLVSRSIPLPEVPDTHVKLFPRDLPRTNISLSLRRKAVRLQGRVIELNNLAKGVGSAKLSVTGVPSTVTDSDGKFEFSKPMPVKTSISITVSATNFDSKTFKYELNYNQPTNSLLISLTRSS